MQEGYCNWNEVTWGRVVRHEVKRKINSWSRGTKVLWSDDIRSGRPL